MHISLLPTLNKYTKSHIVSSIKLPNCFHSHKESTQANGDKHIPCSLHQTPSIPRQITPSSPMPTYTSHGCHVPSSYLPITT